MGIQKLNIFCTCMKILWIFLGSSQVKVQNGNIFGGAKFSIFWWVCLICFCWVQVHIKKKMKVHPLGLRQSIRPIVPHMIATHGCLKLHSL